MLGAANSSSSGVERQKLLAEHKKVEEEYQDMVGELQERLKRSLAEARGMAVEQERQVREDLEPMEIALQRSEEEQLALGDELAECQARCAQLEASARGEGRARDAMRAELYELRSVQAAAATQQATAASERAELARTAKLAHLAAKALGCVYMWRLHALRREVRSARGRSVELEAQLGDLPLENARLQAEASRAAAAAAAEAEAAAPTKRALEDGAAARRGLEVEVAAQRAALRAAAEEAQARLSAGARLERQLDDTRMRLTLCNVHSRRQLELQAAELREMRSRDTLEAREELMSGIDAALHRVAELEGGFGELLRPACNGEGPGGGLGGDRGGGRGSGRGGSRGGGGGGGGGGLDGRTEGGSSALSQLQGLSDKLHALNSAPERGDKQLAIPSFSRISCSAPAARPPPALVRRAAPDVHISTGRPLSAGASCHSAAAGAARHSAGAAHPSAPGAARHSSAAGAACRPRGGGGGGVGGLVCGHSSEWQQCKAAAAAAAAAVAATAATSAGASERGGGGGGGGGGGWGAFGAAAGGAVTWERLQQRREHKAPPATQGAHTPARLAARSTSAAALAPSAAALTPGAAALAPGGSGSGRPRAPPGIRLDDRAQRVVSGAPPERSVGRAW